LRVEPVWLTPAEIIDINRAEVAATGEPHEVHSWPLLVGACARPENQWAYDGEDDVVRLAAKLAAGIAMAHAFKQGNKRTGMTSAVMFLEANGYQWVAPDTEWLGSLMVQLVAHELSIEDFAECIRPFVKASETPGF
jgi:death-on-curing protein